MKSLWILLLLGFWVSCSSQKSHRPPAKAGWETLPLLKGESDTLWIQVPGDSPFVLEETSPQSQLYLGILRADSRLEWQGEVLTMTEISMPMAVAPESGYLAFSEEEIGRWALVRGQWGGMLYEAEVLCVLDREPSSNWWKKLAQGQAQLSERCQ